MRTQLWSKAAMYLRSKADRAGVKPQNQPEPADSRSKRRSSSDLGRQQDRSPPPGGERSARPCIIR